MNINEIKVGDFVVESIYVKMYGRSLFTTYKVIDVDVGSDQLSITLKLYRNTSLGKYDNPDNRNVWYNLNNHVKIRYE